MRRKLNQPTPEDRMYIDLRIAFAEEHPDDFSKQFDKDSDPFGVFVINGKSIKQHCRTHSVHRRQDDITQWYEFVDVIYLSGVQIMPFKQQTIPKL